MFLSVGHSHEQLRSRMPDNQLQVISVAARNQLKGKLPVFSLVTVMLAGKYRVIWMQVIWANEQLRLSIGKHLTRRI